MEVRALVLEEMVSILAVVSGCRFIRRRGERRPSTKERPRSRQDPVDVCLSVPVARGGFILDRRIVGLLTQSGSIRQCYLGIHSRPRFSFLDQLLF